MIYPNVKFIIDPKMINEDIEQFLFDDNSFKDWALEQIAIDHKNLIIQICNKKVITQKKFISEYIENYIKENRNQIESAKDNLQKHWILIEKKIGLELKKILNTDWKYINEITCNVGIFQVYPRDLNKLSTQIYYKSYIHYSAATILHEITHFIYFKKWKELFPKDKPEMFESPHPFWHLSEIMAPIINNEESIRRILPDAVVDTYSEYQKPFDEDMSIYGYFVQKYLEFKKDDKSIEDFLKFARKEILKIDFDEVMLM